MLVQQQVNSFTQFLTNNSFFYPSNLVNNIFKSASNNFSSFDSLYFIIILSFYHFDQKKKLFFLNQLFILFLEKWEKKEGRDEYFIFGKR